MSAVSETFIQNETESAERNINITAKDDKIHQIGSFESGNTLNEVSIEKNLVNQNVESIEVNEEKIEHSSEPEENKNEWLDILGSGGIMKKIIVEGKAGTQPTRSNKCTINYTCSLKDGTVVASESNFSLFLGESDVISGLDVSIALLNVGEICLLEIEPRLAFGEKGLPPNIPPNATVVYELELVSVEPEDEIENLTLEQRKITGNRKRETGNWWYMRGENNLAIQCYRRALDYLDEVESGSIFEDGDNKQQVSDSELQALLEDRINVCNNMAAAQIKLEMYEAALKSLQTVLTCQPDNLKAHFRKAKVYVGKNDLIMAIKCLEKAKELAPEDPEVQKEIHYVTKCIEKQKVSERELARRMFNDPSLKTKDDSSNQKHPVGQTKKKVGILATVGAVIAVGIAGLVAHRLKYS